MVKVREGWERSVWRRGEKGRHLSLSLFSESQTQLFCLSKLGNETGRRGWLDREREYVSFMLMIVFRGK